MNNEKETWVVTLRLEEVSQVEVWLLAQRHDWTISKTCAHLVRLGLMSLGCDGGDPDDLA